MTKIFFSLLLLQLSGYAFSQTLQQAEDKFHEASNLYINKNYDKALASVKEGLKIQPKSEKLEALRKLLEQEKKQEQQKQQQQKEDQEKKDQQNKDQQNKDKQDKEQQNKDQQNKENKDEQNKDQQNKDEKDQKEKDEEQKKKDQEKQGQQKDNKTDEEKEAEQNKEEKEQPNFDSKKLEQMNMSPEKAKMILEAMKNQEKQYLQQQKRKATKPRDRGKPDW